MGLFSKLASNLNHGGVKLTVAAPGSATDGQIIPVTVTITGNEPQTINNVKVELKCQAREQGVNLSGGAGVNASRTTWSTIGQVESHEPFTLAPGETKVVELSLQVSTASGGPLGQLGNAGGAVAGVLKTLATAEQAFEHVNYLYQVYASAEIQGIGFGPSVSQSIQIVAAAAGQPPVGTSVS